MPAAGTPLTAATNVANNSVEAGSLNASITSTAATISTTVSPLLLLVDETSNVLEMLEKTDKQIMEAANTSASSSPGEYFLGSGRIVWSYFHDKSHDQEFDQSDAPITYRISDTLESGIGCLH